GGVVEVDHRCEFRPEEWPEGIRVFREAEDSLTPHELRVQRPRLGDVVGPLDDGPAVGEDGELVALGGEPEHVGVVADVAGTGEAGSERPAMRTSEER